MARSIAIRLISLGLCAAAVAPSGAAPSRTPQGPTVHAYMGALATPEAAPAIVVTLDTGRKARLPDLRRGRTTALQLIFTGCGDTCPIQGANFARIAAAHGRDAGPMQLISVTITPRIDTPATLRQWRRRWSQDDRWLGAIPDDRGLAQLQQFLKGRDGPANGHTTQVFLFDRQAKLVYRSREWARPEELIALMRRWDKG